MKKVRMMIAAIFLVRVSRQRFLLVALCLIGVIAATFGWRGAMAVRQARTIQPPVQATTDSPETQTAVAQSSGAKVSDPQTPSQLATPQTSDAHERARAPE